MSSLTPKTYVMSLTAEEIERRLLSIDNFLLKTIIRQSLLNPATDTVPSTQCVVDALTPINTTISSLGDLAIKDSVALDSNETSGTLSLTKGGTGANSLQTAQQNLGILTQSDIQNLINNSIPLIQTVDLSSNQVNGVLPISKGGTGATSPAQALKNLGIHDSSGKIPASQLPAIAITDVFTANSQTAMLSLNAQQGDVAIRTDISKTFILTADPASTLSNWQEMLNYIYLPPDSTESVKGIARFATQSESNPSNVSSASDALALSVRRALDLLVSPAAAATSSVVGTARFATQSEVDARTSASTIISPDKLREIGVGQSWQNMTSSRVLSTTYTNTTGRPIFVVVGTSASTSATINLTVGGETHPVSQCQVGGSVFRVVASALIPVNATYSVTGTSIEKWVELR